MLRDKFIHYFQQWRERQLSRGDTGWHNTGGAFSA